MKQFIVLLILVSVTSVTKAQTAPVVDVNQNNVAALSNTKSAMPVADENGPVAISDSTRIIVNHDWAKCGLSFIAFDDLVRSVRSKPIVEAQMEVVTQTMQRNCLTTVQVKGLANLFSLEEDKLAFVKFAYHHTSDKKNFNKVNDVFGSEASIEELNRYIDSK